MTRRLSALTLIVLLAAAVATPSAAETVACYDHGHGYNAHGWIGNGGQAGAAEYVTLRPYGDSWVGDRYESLTVYSTRSWQGSGTVTEVAYTLPAAGTPYYGAERNVIRWTVCKGTAPATTTTTQPTTTSTQPTTTSTQPTTTSQPTTTTEVPPSSTVPSTSTTRPQESTTTTSSTVPASSSTTTPPPTTTSTTPSGSSSTTTPAPTSTAPTTSSTVQISVTSITPPVQVDDTWPITYTTPDVLPRTGVDAGALVAGAAALLLVGGLMVAGRKEDPASDCTHPSVRRGVIPGTGVCLTCGVNFYQGAPEK